MATALGFLALAVMADAGTQPPGAIELPPYFDRAITRADLEGRNLHDLELMCDLLLYRMGEPMRPCLQPSAEHERRSLRRRDDPKSRH